MGQDRGSYQGTPDDRLDQRKGGILRIENKINGEIILLDTVEVWQEVFRHWDALVPTDVAERIATATQRFLESDAQRREARTTSNRWRHTHDLCVLQGPKFTRIAVMQFEDDQSPLEGRFGYYDRPSWEACDAPAAIASGRNGLGLQLCGRSGKRSGNCEFWLEGPSR